MTYTVRKLDYRPWPVSVGILVCDDNGETTEVRQTFIAHFKPFTEEQVKAIREEIFGVGTDEELAARAEARCVADQGALEAQFLTRLVCGWSKLIDENDTPLTFSEAALIALATGMDGVPFRRGFNDAIVQIRFGIAPAKNVVTSPAPGPAPAADEVATS